MATRYPALFAMFIVTGASKNMASRHVATMLNHSSSDGIGGERDVHDMTGGAAKGVTPTAKRSQRLGEMHGARYPARRTKVSSSESKFRLQARGSPVHRLSETPSAHSLAFGPWIWWQGLPLSQAAGALAPSANTSRNSRETDGAFNEQEARDGCSGAQPSPTPT